MALGISIKAHVKGATISCLPETKEFKYGFRYYQEGPACVQVQALDEAGEETLFLNIPDRFAKEFAEGILKVLDAPNNGDKSHPIG